MGLGRLKGGIAAALGLWAVALALWAVRQHAPAAPGHVRWRWALLPWNSF